MKHYNGNYCLAKKTSSIFNFDKENRLLSYLDEFTIISRLSEEQLHDHAFNTRIFNTHGENEPEKQKEIMMNTMKRFLDMKIFSVKELQVARAVAYNPGITRARLASDFNVTVSTIDTYFSRFLEKARDFFIRDFPTVDAAAKYLREEGLV